jgi:chitin disaccharide deacetylase
MAIPGLTSEILGYPRDARYLILNIDDYGFCFTANNSAIYTLEHGMACSTTVMMPPPWSKHACQLLRNRPQLSHGIHLTAISEHEIYRWRPLTSPEKIPTLVDREGFFPLETAKSDLLARASVQELEIEWRAQIESGLAHGLHPVQLDSHCNIHDSRPDIFEMTVRLALEYKLALRVHQAHFIDQLKALGLPVIDHPDLDSFDLPTSGKAARYLRMLHELPAGVSEWAIHCARGTAELRTINPRWRVRAADFQFFNSPECRNAITAEGIQIISYEKFQPYWKK